MDDIIEEIGIDEANRLYVKPSTATFPYIYREAMEVHWDGEGHFLYGAPPRKWSFVDWFNQILLAAQEQGCRLHLAPGTSWVNIPLELRIEMQEAQGGRST
jgi:hypothetical protein